MWKLRENTFTIFYVFFSDDDDDEEPPFSMWKPKTPEDSEDDTDQENRFKVLPFELSPRGKITPKIRVKGRPDPRFDDSAIRLLSPKVIEKLTHRCGLPPGLKPFLELEAARLQLGVALFHHSTIKCDRLV